MRGSNARRLAMLTKEFTEGTVVRCRHLGRDVEPPVGKIVGPFRHEPGCGIVVEVSGVGILNATWIEKVEKTA